MGKGWYDRRTIRIDENAFTLWVGPEKVAMAELAEDGKTVKATWYNDFGSWHPLQTSVGLQEAFAKASSMLTFVGKGTGKGKEGSNANSSSSSSSSGGAGGGSN